MQQGSVLEVTITDLNTSGEGVGRINGKVIFVPDTVAGDRILARVTRVKSQYIEAKLQKLLTASGDRIRPRCIVADKCGGCQWQHINWESQLVAKQQQLTQALQRIGNLPEIQVQSTLHAPEDLSYRNKATYPLGTSATGNVQAGYYRKNSHKIVNLNQCPVQDSRLNPLLQELKQDIQQQGWSIYDETNPQDVQGQLRHLGLRIGHHTGEILVTLVAKDHKIPRISEQAAIWLDRYPNLMGVCLNINPRQNNVILGGQTEILVGQPYIKEIFGGLEFRICSDTFFQVNTAAAELLLEKIIEVLNLQGHEILVDAYCGIGTFTLPLAQKVKQAIGIEIHPASIVQARQNAAINQITNVDFYTGRVEECLRNLELDADIMLLDPPRKGCDRQVIETLLNLRPAKIVYVSCKPATLARDLKLLCSSGIYQIQLVQPVDFFPQTSHIESLVVLQKRAEPDSETIFL
ncbi:23S rRNA (uracil-5-)-methyltransferase RumA [Xenococcus sp. PCC 7305]|uniref:23S rRNA (uracil(1939)-C(5))-methyltransferase RlmD n=1 Tax=Xenococcus sp. PCC 7305 TaxID=102125 RepID=UPI0002AC0DC3|nr:23S rRNA (uracil(1939)-C(5))-methyltransferase RlmD [Xenococcus sp. PCC 7305]ELS03923.1 23S rRNA (uracil-5-)-methyltransferase RumA [Xenococcus sp. PCC 7305]